MAAKKKSTAPMPVEAIVHADKRTNLPTADAHDLVSSDVNEIVQVSYPRNIYSPMLVWRGKEQLDDQDLEVDAPPIYIQEKIDPRVLVENLRTTANKGEDEPEFTLFESFDGLDDLDLVDFYQHESNWSNRMILGDALQVMASLAERERLRGKVQMIYIDPPYGIKFGSNWQVSARKRDVKDGNLADVAREVEQIKAFRDTWEDGIHSYLSYLRDRLMVARDLLTESGSVFVQIGDENVHLVRSLLDEVFGRDNHIANIVFRTSAGLGSSTLKTVADNLIWFARDRSALKFRRLFLDKAFGSDTMFGYVEDNNGLRRSMSPSEKKGEIAPEVRPYRYSDLVSSGLTPSCVFDFEFQGRTFKPGRSRSWKTNAAGMEQLNNANRLAAPGNTLQYITFFDDFPVSELSNVWMDTVGELKKTYVVQTSTRILERCMMMCTDPGDLVLDPTCGSGTTAFVAEQWGRRWITIDSSRVALALARQRLMGAKFPYYLLADSAEGRKKEEDLIGSRLPAATPTGDIRHGFVYERVQHITLKSIANNPDIREGMSRAEIDAAIKRHADFELLYDRPYEDKKKVRVTGPFTVESLSPHRNLAGLGGDVTVAAGSGSDAADVQSFEQTILDNLRAAGIQNGKRKERLTFDAIEPYAAAYIQAVGIRETVDDGSPKKVGICVGPQYGTVSPAFVKSAAREALKETDLDLLCILGFAFDPQVIGGGDDYVASDDGFDVAAERSLGRIPILLVRMNSDLLMGEELKKTGAGNLFTVFGEPDIDVKVKRGEVTVKLRGVDVYDPSTGEVRSSGTDQVALWMIDTDYNGESFFVRHCYFTGGQDPYKRLRNTLKAEIDEEAWQSLYSDESRPFPVPESRKIAVKVINDYGDEVLKVFDV